MTYHDNDVAIKLKSDSGYQIISGNYTIEKFSVTSGQDPDGNIRVGTKANLNNDGVMSFKVGRKGSSDVANFFTSNIAANQTTFNHNPDDLNFAFIGTLVLTLQNNSPGGNQGTFTFSNIAIAQGHSGSTNNWWFGGQSCKNIGSNTVVCMGINSNPGGFNLQFDFLRGGTGNSVNEVDAWLAK